MTISENSAMQVAHSILERSFQPGESRLSHLKLQKILYILHGWHLATYDRPAFRDNVEAWDYGPVVQSVYHEFKHYSDRLIEPSDAIRNNLVDDAQSPNFKGVLDTVWERYKDYNSFQLVYLTHERGTPWDIARNERHSSIIDNDLIKEYYQELIKRLDS